MKKFGFKALLLTFTLALVALSVSISSYISYSNESAVITKMITASTTNYVENQVGVLEGYFADKVKSSGNLAKQFQNKKIANTPEQNIEMTKIIASATGLSSVVIGYENGEGYWNQTASKWPNHTFAGDITTTSFYQAAMTGNGTTVTMPYLDTSGDKYWISIVDKIYGGMISIDMDLNFLGKMVNSAVDIPGSIVVIISEDTSVLASTSEVMKVGEKGSDVESLKNVLINATQSPSTLQEFTVDGVDKFLFSQEIKVGDKSWYFVLGLDKSIAFADLESIESDAIMVGIIACLISVLVAYFVIQQLYRPILSLKKMIVGLSQGDGDLTQRLEVTTNDDLGQIADGVNKFIASLQSMMIEVQGVSSTLQSNVDTLNMKSVQNAAILQNHVSETEQVVTAIEEMNATAEAMATDAANTALLTQKANDASDVSLATVNQAQNAVTALVKEVDDTALSVQGMSDETDGINSILQVIGGIAEQTNLLALNAAIEAARAGEQGRGFAVVADEVRSLAGRSKESTEQIELALSGLLTGNQSVVEAMETTKNRCQETADGMTGVTASLDTMTQFVDDINGLSTQIATAAEEQSSVTQEVSRNMSAINDIVQKLDNNGKDALAESENIARVNKQLIEIVGRFKL